jgi:hypothetical protein
MSPDIEANLARYLGDRGPTERYASFDYCFNFFQQHHERGTLSTLLQPGQLEQSCLQLGFYLASWGMFRGSTDLLQHSARHLAPLVKAIVHAPHEIWRTDVHLYGDRTCPVVFDTAEQLRAALSCRASDTLVTKVMLGTFGAVPAFDVLFKRGFRVWKFGPSALRKIREFYEKHSEVIDARRVRTLDFESEGSNRSGVTRPRPGILGTTARTLDRARC